MPEESLIEGSLKLAVVRVWDKTIIVIWAKSDINEVVCRRQVWDRRMTVDNCVQKNEWQ
jgi:hypothetical protein